jgi:hypothetical protein
LNENQIKIWFQNKRAKMKKQSNQPNPLRGLLVAGGLYNHSTATSDCSESYANGLADDIGNRAMRDVEPDDGDDREDENSNACLDSDSSSQPSPIDRFKQQGSRALKSLSDRSGCNRLVAADQDNSQRISKQQQQQQQQQLQLQQAIGDKFAQVDTLKRRRTSQSDGDDEAEAEDSIGGRNSNSGSHHLSHHPALIKRTKLTHMERNSLGQRLIPPSHAHLSRMVNGDDREDLSCAGELRTGPIVENRVADDDEEPVITVG